MKAILFAVLAGLCWGVGELFTKSVLHSKQIGPITAITIRSTVALPILWMFYIFAFGSLHNEPRDWFKGADSTVITKLVLGSGVIAGALAMLFFYLALSMGEISRIKPIAFALAPATAVILGWLFLGESMTPRKAIAVLLILAGVVLLTGGQPTPAHQPPEEQTPATE